MSRSIAKLALCVLVFFAWVDAKRRRVSQQAAKSAHKEALRVWEDEGGALR